MQQLPTGTLTFLFTDIEGSTRLWDQFPEQMQPAHARHSELVIACVERHNGIFVRTRGEGDSTFSVFADALDALSAACAFQRALTAEAWPQPTPIKVRAALHTGIAHLRDNDYNSSDVNRCARLRAIVHGGQTILSQSVYDLVAEWLPEGITLKDMGLHRLKDLSRPEHVYQLLHPDLPDDFAPLASLDPVTTNLPQQLTSFIGREAEMEQVRWLLETTRLLTLTGMGGAGKTRLALQVAADLVEAYPDGAWLVELAPLSDSTLVTQEVASALGVPEEPGRTLLQTLTDHLMTKHLLLLLDNAEHLLPACAELAQTLLKSCPHLRLLITSREAVKVTGEQVYRVPFLRAPDPNGLPTKAEELVAAILDYEASRLFAERASLRNLDFTLTRENASAVASLCHRLEGIPLAIELAAARVSALSAEEINARLEHRFRLLRGGSRTALPRQQTLQAAIDWSYELLTEQERLLLRRLSVFAGGWTLEAAEAVCSEEQVEAYEVLDLLTSLVDKSLVIAEEQEGKSRYRLLETIREYSQQRFQEGDSEKQWRGRHLNYFLQLAEEAETQLTGAEQAEWFDKLQEEHDNLRAALEWCQIDTESQEAGLRLAGSLCLFWDIRCYVSEGREYLQAALSQETGPSRTPARAKALNAAGNLAQSQYDFAAARAFYEQSLAIRKELGDRKGVAGALHNLGMVASSQSDYTAARQLYEEALAINREIGNSAWQAKNLNSLGGLAIIHGDYATARTLHEQSLALYKEIGDALSIAWTLENLGDGAANQGNYAEAQALYEESLAIRRELGDKRGIAISLLNLGGMAFHQGNYAAGLPLCEECLALYRELGDKNGIAWSFNGLGLTAYRQGEVPAARGWQEQSLILFRELGNKFGIANSLENLAEFAVAQGETERAARLWGAAEVLREAIGSPLPQSDKEEYDHQTAAARTTLSDKAFTAAWEQGRAMTIEQAIAYALYENQQESKERPAESTKEGVICE